MKTKEPGDEPMSYGWMDMSVPSKKLRETMSEKGGIQAISQKKDKGTGTSSNHRLDEHVSFFEETAGDDVKKGGIQARGKAESLAKLRIDLSA